MVIKGNHPLAEILAKKLFGIESVPPKEQTIMVRRAINAAVEWYETQIKLMDKALEFYANEDNWDIECGDPYVGLDNGIMSNDWGDCARKAREQRNEAKK